jgi:hypothetical protein
MRYMNDHEEMWRKNEAAKVDKLMNTVQITSISHLKNQNIITAHQTLYA